MTKIKLNEEYEEFRLQSKHKVDYQKINENLSFMAYMQDEGLEEYILYKCTPPCNEIEQEFYTHLQPTMGD